MFLLEEEAHPRRVGRARACPSEHRYWCFSAEQPAPVPHLAHPEGCAAHPEGCAALRIVLVTAPRVSLSCGNFPDGFRPSEKREFFIDEATGPNPLFNRGDLVDWPRAVGV